MKFGTLLANLAGLVVFVSPAAAGDKCGSSYPEPEALEAATRLRDAQRAEGALRRRRDDGEGLLITTYVHVVEDTQHAGFVTDVMITDQVRPESGISRTRTHTHRERERKRERRGGERDSEPHTTDARAQPPNR